MKTETELSDAGFTASGIDRYRNAVEDFDDQLYSKSMALGEADKAHNGNPEITYDHVRSGVVKIMAKGLSSSTPLKVVVQIGEYICMLGVGAGASNLTEKWGTLLFVGSACTGVILFVYRSLVGNKL